MSWKKILLISHELSVTGAPLVLLSQAKYLKKAGYTVDLWTLKDGPLKEDFHNIGCTVRYIENNYTSFLSTFHKYHDEYSVILCNTTETYKCIFVLESYSVPVIWFIHETKLVDTRVKNTSLFASLFTKFYNLYTVSEYAAKCIKKYNPHVKIINNAVQDFFIDFSVPREKITFGFIGTIATNKGIDLLIDAFLHLYTEYSNINLVIAGNYKNTLGESLYEQTKDHPAIKWLGLVQAEDKKSFFNNIDILCVPSLEDSCPLVVFEGTMYGKGIITTNTVGSNFLVDDGSSGYIVESNNALVLYEAMKKILSQDIHAIMHASREKYQQYGTCEREEKEVLRMIEDNIHNIHHTCIAHKMKIRCYIAFYSLKKMIFRKVKKADGVRELYVFGIKIYSYTSKKKKIPESANTCI